MSYMRVTVRLFAMLRQRAGTDELELELPDGARVDDVLDRLADLAAGMPLVLAVNREYAQPDHPLQPGDELALIPPVSGGETQTVHTRVTQEPLAIDHLRERVRDARAGAIVCFEGVTREVQRLDYEAYIEMAEKKMAAICEQTVTAFGLCACVCEHRVGSVPLSEPSVVVCVSAPHRAEAFAGAREVIDRVKEQVPIWKKEIDDGGERWVEGTRPANAG